MFVYQVFSNPKIMPWKLQTSLSNCVHLIKNFHLKSHIYKYKEENTCVDDLANVAFSYDQFTYMNPCNSTDLDGHTVGFGRIQVQKPNPCKSTDGKHRPNSD